MSTYGNKLSIRLRELREKKNLLQKDIAKLLNITTSAYGYYEQGKRDPDTQVINLLADFYGVSSDHILGRKNNSTSESKNSKQNSLITDIENLNPKSKEYLEEYVKLLKLKEHMDKSLVQPLSTLELKQSKGK